MGLSIVAARAVKNRPLIVGNWKMHGLFRQALAELRKLGALMAGAGKIPADVAICPPATLLCRLADALATQGLSSLIRLGGQDCHPERQGAFTGDLSAEMLKDAGAEFVILGHSERRAAHRETDALIRAKTIAAQRAGLVGIVCVGEGPAERDNGARKRVLAQLSAALPDAASAAHTVIAYEPVWAIGTGRTPKAEEIADMHGALRAALRARYRDGVGFRILYGGSVTPLNAGAILAIPDVDGVLVGGASLKATDFWKIIEASPRV
jgi:triosephosphate isomerase